MTERACEGGAGTWRRQRPRVQQAQKSGPWTPPHHTPSGPQWQPVPQAAQAQASLSSPCLADRNALGCCAKPHKIMHTRSRARTDTKLTIPPRGHGSMLPRTMSHPNTQAHTYTRSAHTHAHTPGHAIHGVRDDLLIVRALLGDAYERSLQVQAQHSRGDRAVPVLLILHVLGKLRGQRKHTQAPANQKTKKNTENMKPKANRPLASSLSLSHTQPHAVTARVPWGRHHGMSPPMRRRWWDKRRSRRAVEQDKTMRQCRSDEQKYTIRASRNSKQKEV